MTPEQRQAKLLELQIDQCAAQVRLLQRMALASCYLREDLARQIIGPCETFAKAIGRVDPEEFGVPGLRAIINKRKTR